MKIMRKPFTNSIIITVVSAFYAFIFISASGHIELERILNHPATLNSTFWNLWNVFLRQGNLKHIGYFYIALTLAIVILSIIRKRDYDEYQTGILEKGLIISGIAMVALFPITILLILSDRGYAIEFVTFLVVAHWSILLIADLIYVIKQGKA